MGEVVVEVYCCVDQFGWFVIFEQWLVFVGIVLVDLFGFGIQIQYVVLWVVGLDENEWVVVYVGWYVMIGGLVVIGYEQVVFGQVNGCQGYGFFVGEQDWVELGD